MTTLDRSQPPPSRKCKIDPQKLKELTDSGMKQKDIAKELNVSREGVAKAQKRLGLQKKQQIEDVKEIAKSELKLKIWKKYKNWANTVEGMILDVMDSMQIIKNIEEHYKEEAERVGLTDAQAKDEYIQKVMAAVWDKAKLMELALAGLGKYTQEIEPTMLKYRVLELIQSAETREEAEKIRLGLHKTRDELRKIESAVVRRDYSGGGRIDRNRFPAITATTDDNKPTK